MSALQKAESLFQQKPGWVINPWFDFVAFYVPILVALFFKLPGSVNIYFTKITFDIGHLFVTVIPLYLFSRAGEVNMKPAIIIPVVVLIMAQILCYFNFQLFTYVFGYYALFHICAQLYGWVAKVQRTSTVAISTFELAFERSFVAIMLLSSVLFWHTTYSSMQRSWFYKNNLVLEIPRYVWDIVDFVFLVMLACWCLLLINNFIKKRSNPIGKVLLIASIWLMFYYSLILNTSSQYGMNFFWFAVVVNHGLSYILFIFSSYQPKTKGRTVPYFVLYVVGIILVGACWEKLIKFTNTLDVRYAATLVWGPLILHYAVDSIIWKRSFAKRLHEKAHTEAA